jgi:hypothetical protein
MPLQGGLSIERMCELARVSRASFYRSLKEQRTAEEETKVRSAIQQIALEPSPTLRLLPDLCGVAAAGNSPTFGRVRLPGGDSRCLFSQGGGMGARSDVGESVDDFSAERAIAQHRPRPGLFTTRIAACNTLAANTWPSWRSTGSCPA